MGDRKSSAAVLYCDMDGVLCNFYSAVLALTGQPPGELGVKELWGYTRQVADFWESLKWMPGANRLWNHVDRHGGHILSSVPASDPNCVPGKLRWLDRNLQLTDPNRIHLLLRTDKRRFAAAGTTANVLIDDYRKNIREWEQSGGIGILHQNASESIAGLNKLGFR